MLSRLSPGAMPLDGNLNRGQPADPIAIVPKATYRAQEPHTGLKVSEGVGRATSGHRVPTLADDIFSTC